MKQIPGKMERNYSNKLREIMWYGESFFLRLFQNLGYFSAFCVIMFVEYFLRFTLHKKWIFPLRISSVNVTKSTGNCGFGHIFWRYPEWKTSFFVQCHVHKCYWFLLTIFLNLTKFGPTISILLLRLSEYRFDFALPCA